MEDFFAYFLAYKYLIYLVILSFFLGVEVFSKAPVVLHTPLVSGSHFLHGVIIVGAIYIMGESTEEDIYTLLLGSLAVILGSFNVMGGFLVTDRMLSLFKKDDRK